MELELITFNSHNALEEPNQQIFLRPHDSPSANREAGTVPGKG
jgi:hypothetical protein